MAEENQVQQELQQVITKEPQQVTTKEPQQVTTKDPKKVEVGRRLAAHNCKKREAQKKSEGPSGASRVRQYYGIGAVLAVGMIGGLGYYIYQTKKGDISVPCNPSVSQPSPQTNKFEMD